MSVRVAALDLNGIWRGKRLPEARRSAALGGEILMPLSAAALDVTGADVKDSPLVFASGDRDGRLRPTGREVPMPWLGRPTTLVPAALETLEGEPFAVDPRVALASAVARLEALGLSPLCAFEPEFHLISRDAEVEPPVSPVTGRQASGDAILSLQALDAFAPVLDAIYDGAEAMGIPLGDALSEGGPGQFELGLAHRPALEAADDVALLRLLVRGTARAHGLGATFMAKPYPDAGGNGLHVHVSLVRADGANAFGEGEAGEALLRHAVAGALRAMHDCTLVFAPHAGSFERLEPGSHAPVAAHWGFENRTTAIRIPSGPAAARRFEHRVPGGDCCPHLALAAILGAALAGIEDAAEPPEPVTGDAYAAEAPPLAPDWAAAVRAFDDGVQAARLFDPALIDAFARTKRQEISKMEGLDRPARVAVMREAV